MRIRKRDKAERHAVFYDGTRVGERGVDGKVIDRSCPDWFPALAREWDGTDSITVYAGDLLVKPNGHMIWHSPNGALRIEPGWWVVRDHREFLSMSPAVFEDEYEPAASPSVTEQEKT